MNKLLKLIEENKDKIAFCDDCDWQGIPSDCETFQETEGFAPEQIEYTVAICPKCSSEEVRFIDKELR